MSDPAPSHADTGPAQPDETGFALSVENIREHPEAGSVARAVRAASHIEPAEADIVAWCVGVEVLSQADAEQRGEPENSGAVLVGYEVAQAARDCDVDWILARHASLPDGMSCREFILRRALERYDLSLDQRAVLAAMLGALTCTDSAASSSPPDAETDDTEEDTRLQAAAVAVMVPPRLVVMAEDLLANAPALADNVLDGHLPLYLAMRQAEQRQLKRDCLAGGPCFMAQLRSLTGLLKQCLTPDSVPTADRDKILAALKEMSEFVALRHGASE